jgi:hypothetical protein
VREDALTGLAECGKEGPRALRSLLARRSLIDFHAGLLEDLVALDRSEAAKVAREIALDEQAYWDRTSPTLEPEFDQGAGLAGDEERDYLLARRKRLVVAIAILHWDGSSEEVLSDLARLWRRPVLAQGAPEVRRALSPGIPY